jgi:hypothetical protein
MSSSPDLRHHKLNLLYHMSELAHHQAMVLWLAQRQGVDVNFHMDRLVTRINDISQRISVTSAEIIPIRVPAHRPSAPPPPPVYSPPRAPAQRPRRLVVNPSPMPPRRLDFEDEDEKEEEEEEEVPATPEPVVRIPETPPPIQPRQQVNREHVITACKDCAYGVCSRSSVQEPPQSPEF